MHDQEPERPISLQDYRKFRIELEARVETGAAFGVDVERIKREYLGLEPAAPTASPSQRQARIRNLRRARLTTSLTREALLVS